MRKKPTQIARVGVDLAKSVIQVHAVDASDAVVAAKQLQRSAFLPWCERLPRGCVVAMEAGCASNYWARKLNEMGFVAKLLSPSFVTPYRMSGRTGKNDANDAAAICEAAGRPQMRFVPVKTPTQQGWLAVHSLRAGYIEERTACMNRIRALMAECGILFPVRTHKFHDEALKALESAGADLTPLARAALKRCVAHFGELQRQIVWCDKQIKAHVGSDAHAAVAFSVCGVGILGASAFSATLGDLSQFRNGRQLSAWLGLVPRMYSSGGKERLGRITRRGDTYLRSLLVVGAHSALASAPKRDDDVSRWAVQLRARVGWGKACVALASRNARTLWRLMKERREQPVNPQVRRRLPIARDSGELVV